MKKKSVRNQEREEAIKELREILKPGDTLYTILRSVSRSGMNRRISVVKLDGESQFHLDVLAGEKLLGYNLGKRTGYFDGRRYERKLGNGDGVPISGCGMDMGFELVYQISSALFRDGFECTGENCPSNDHSNGDRDRTPHHHGSGGYALRQRWL